MLQQQDEQTMSALFGASRVLTPNKRKWATTELDASAVV